MEEGERGSRIYYESVPIFVLPLFFLGAINLLVVGLMTDVVFCREYRLHHDRWQESFVNRVEMQR